MADAASIRTDAGSVGTTVIAVPILTLLELQAGILLLAADHLKEKL